MSVCNFKSDLTLFVHKQKIKCSFDEKNFKNVKREKREVQAERRAREDDWNKAGIAFIIAC